MCLGSVLEEVGWCGCTVFAVVFEQERYHMTIEFYVAVKLVLNSSKYFNVLTFINYLFSVSDVNLNARISYCF